MNKTHTRWLWRLLLAGAALTFIAGTAFWLLQGSEAPEPPRPEMPEIPADVPPPIAAEPPEWAAEVEDPEDDLGGDQPEQSPTPMPPRDPPTAQQQKQYRKALEQASTTVRAKFPIGFQLIDMDCRETPCIGIFKAKMHIVPVAPIIIAGEILKLDLKDPDELMRDRLEAQGLSLTDNCDREINIVELPGDIPWSAEILVGYAIDEAKPNEEDQEPYWGNFRDRCDENFDRIAPGSTDR